jgi:hypothetical protein
MKAQFATELTSSFYLWLEHKLIDSKFKAYSTNESNAFQYVSSFIDVPSSHVAYQGKFKQLVADQSVDVPNSGIFVNGSFISGNANNVYIDYDNGRVIFPQASGTGLTITANNTIKEVNTYITEDDEESILVTSDFINSAETSSTNLFSKTDKRDEKTYILPACFVRFVNNENNEFSFGGEEETTSRIQVIVMAYDNYTLDNVLSLLADTARECIIRVPFESFPYGRFFDVKSFPYSYNTYASNYSSKSFIESVNTSKINSSVILNKHDKDVLVGLVDFDISTYRFPRV